MRPTPSSALAAMVLVLCGLGSTQPPAAGAPLPAAAGPASPRPLKVLLVTPAPGAESAALARLLAARGLAVKVAAWAEAADEGQDVTLLAGPAGRSRRGEALPDSLPLPVLGLGPYGCGWFGRLKLKNGHPYT